MSLFIGSFKLISGNQQLALSNVDSAVKVFFWMNLLVHETRELGAILLPLAYIENGLFQ